MPFVYNEETGAESVEVYNMPVYKVEPGIIPGLFQEIRFEANRPLSNADIDHLHDLVRYHWDSVVVGDDRRGYSDLDDMWCDADNAYSTQANFGAIDANHDDLIQRAIQFVGTLNTRIALGTDTIAPMPDTKVTVWLSEVSKNVSSR